MNRMLSSGLLISMIACGGAQKPVPPDTTPPTLTMWNKRDPQASLLPPGARRVQLVVTAADDEEHRLVWVVAEGKQVATVFRVDTNELLEATTQALKDKQQQQNTVTLTVGDASQGSPLGPGPRPGPGPIGLPPSELVLRAAQDLDRARL